MNTFRLIASFALLTILVGCATARQSQNQTAFVAIGDQSFQRTRSPEAVVANRLGLNKVIEGEIEGAVADFTRAIRLDPGYAEAYHNRAMASLEEYDVSGAGLNLENLNRTIIDLGKAIDLNPASLDDRLLRGAAESYRRDNSGGIGDLNKAIYLKSSVVFDVRGVARTRLRDLGPALVNFDQAIGLDPKFGVAYQNRARAKLAQGDLEGAIADRIQALELDPTIFRTDRAENWSVALAEITKAQAQFELQPGSAEAQYAMGDAWRNAGDAERANQHLTRALAINPNLATAFGSRGLLELKLGRLDQAIADFDRAIALRPDSIEDYGNRGTAKALKGDAAGAVADLRVACEQNPVIALDLVEHDLDDGDLELGRMIADFHRRLATAPPDPAAAAAIAVASGNAKRAAGDSASAKADYESALALDPANALAARDLGLVNRTLGDTDGALAAFRLGATRGDLRAAYDAFVTRDAAGQHDEAVRELRAAIIKAGLPVTDDEKWRFELGRLLLGEGTLPDLLDSAASRIDFTERGRLCEAWYYQGALQKNAKQEDDARNSFRRAVEIERRDLPADQEAARELKAIADRRENELQLRR